MHIIIDEREYDLFSKIDSIVNFEGNNTTIQISKEVLPLGDIVIQTDDRRQVVLIERKSLSDLLASIKDGRYEEQSYRLIHTGDYSPHNIIYMIEGMFSQLRTPMEKRIVISAITSLNHFKGFSVLRTCSLNETAEQIVWMAEKMEKELQRGKQPAYVLSPPPPMIIPTTRVENNNNNNNEQLPEENMDLHAVARGGVAVADNYCTVVKKVKKDNITPDNIGEIILCQIPGISCITAIAIMKQYGTFSKLIDDIRINPTVLENVVCQNNGKSRKISKSCVKNVIDYLTK